MLVIFTKKLHDTWCQRSKHSSGFKVLLKRVWLKLLSTTHVFVINSFQAQSWHMMGVLPSIGRFNISLIFKVRIDFSTINIDFGDSVPVRKMQDYYQNTQIFWGSFHFHPSDTRRLQCVDVNKLLQTVSKRVYTAYTYSHSVIYQLLCC